LEELIKIDKDSYILGIESHNTIIQTLYKDYGEDVASEFVDNIQFIVNKWLLIAGFSVGMEDCLVSKKINPDTGMSKTDEINAEITKCYIKAKGLERTTHNPGISEIRVNAALNEARDIGLKIAKDALDPDNDFIKTAMAGSKGDFVNIAQITGLLGQQNLLGKRIPRTMNHGKRTLPHYPMKIDSDTADGLEMEFESRGFIRHSYIHGLNPQEFYFQAMSGREGICDTAMGTANSGYMQRRLVKLCEDVSVQYDGTVRDASGRIYQYAFGENGMDATKLIKTKHGNTSCDVARLVARLNMKATDSQ
jgi:DNA-directed RNA polymerase II subunit RPB1